MKFKNIKITNMTTLLLIIIFCGAYQKTYPITAVQAARQQQILKEIDDVLTEKVDGSNYEAWIKKVDQLAQKNKNVPLPVVQQQIKSLQKIVAIEKEPVSSDEKTIMAQVDALLKMEIKISTKQQDIAKYGEWKAKVMDLISKNWDKSFRINKILEPLKEKYGKLDEDERKANRPSEPIRQGEGKTKTLTQEEKAILNKIGTLETEGDNEFLKVTRGEAKNKIFDQEAFKIWREKAEDLISQSNTMPSPIPQAGVNLSNLLNDIEQELKKLSTSPKTGTILSTPIFNPPSTKGSELTQEEQLFTKKVDDLSKKNLNPSVFNTWAQDVEQTFKESQQSTSNIIKNAGEKLRISLGQVENKIYNNANNAFNKKFTEMKADDYDKWKDGIKGAINDFYKLWDLAAKIQAPHTESLLLQVKQMEKKIEDEDQRRASLTTNPSTGTLTLTESKMVGEALKIFQRLSDINNEITSYKTLEEFISDKTKLLDTIIESEKSIPTIQLSDMDRKTLYNQLKLTREVFFEQARSLMSKTVTMQIPTILTKLLSNIQEKKMTPEEIKEAEAQDLSIIYFLQNIHNDCKLIYRALDTIKNSETLHKDKVANLYGNLCKELFGSEDLGKDFDGTPQKLSVVKAINKVKTMIIDYYIKNADPSSASEKSFVTGIRDQIKKLIELLIEISDDLLNSKIIDVTHIKNFKNFLEPSTQEFIEKVTQIYGQ